MADVYKLTDSNLTAVAQEIRTKGGTSARLSFPDGFVSALRNIQTVATTPSIPAESKVLTPNDSSWTVKQGMHGGNDQISVVVQTKTVRPGLQSQTVYPDSGYYLKAIVEALSANATQPFAFGHQTLPSQKTFTLTGLPFTPIGAVICLQSYNGGDSDQKTFFAITKQSGMSYCVRVGRYVNDYNKNTDYFTFSNGSVTYDISRWGSTYRLYGTYFYFVWGA